MTLSKVLFAVLTIILVTVGCEYREKEYDLAAQKARVLAKLAAIENKISHLGTDPNRCRELTGDHLATAAEATERTTWALDCHEKWMNRAITNFQDELATEHDAIIRLLNNRRGEYGSVLYPTYGEMGLNGIPNNRKSFFAFPTPNPLGRECELPEDYKIVATCISGCVTAEQKLLFPSGNEPISLAKPSTHPTVVTLSPESDRDSLQFTESEVMLYLTDVSEGQHEILTLQLESGRKLRVTPHHPLLSVDGVMRKADSYLVGEALMSVDGGEDRIESVQGETYFGKVYNVLLKSEDPMRNIIAVEGILNGSARYQNEQIRDVNRQLMRITFPESLL